MPKFSSDVQLLVFSLIYCGVLELYNPLSKPGCTYLLFGSISYLDPLFFYKKVRRITRA